MSNTLGPRSWYAYEGDDGVDYRVFTDDDLATAMNMTRNDSNRQLPRRYEARGVWAEATVSGRKVRKFLIAPTNDNTAYASESTSTVTVAGTAFRTTGRRGEQVSYGVNPPNDDGGII
jgi:hypothetical protein